MQYKTFKFSYYQFSHVINRVFDYWHSNLKNSTDDELNGFCSWLKNTYNITWDMKDNRHIIQYDTEEDWVRFWLEWG